MTLRPSSRVVTIAAVLAAGWGLFALCGGRVARLLAARFIVVLQRVANGKFDDPVAFVHDRLYEGLVLVSAAVVLWILAALAIRALRSRGLPRLLLGTVAGGIVFCCLNVMAWCAAHTVIFWAAFYDKVEVDNFAQYHIKRALMSGIRGKPRVVLIGNSQTNRSIDEIALNNLAGGKFWATELSQPGTKGFDLLTLTRQMPLQPGDTVLCYLSEIYFHGGGTGQVAAEFFSFREIPDALALGGWDLFPDGAIASGLFGRVVPMYRFRNSFSHAVLGWPIINLKQKEFDASLEVDLHAQAERRAKSLVINRESAFEYAAFARMVGEVSGRGCQVVLVAGHNHPALQRQMDPRLRPAMLAFLRQLQTDHPGRVEVMDGALIFPPAEADFADLVHFTDAAQDRFTAGLARHLLRTRRE